MRYAQRSTRDPSSSVAWRMSGKFKNLAVEMNVNIPPHPPKRIPSTMTRCRWNNKNLKTVQGPLTASTPKTCIIMYLHNSSWFLQKIPAVCMYPLSSYPCLFSSTSLDPFKTTTRSWQVFGNAYLPCGEGSWNDLGTSKQRWPLEFPWFWRSRAFSNRHHLVMPMKQA